MLRCSSVTVVFPGGAEGPDASDEPLEVLKKQLQECTELLEEGRDGGVQRWRKARKQQILSSL